MSRTARRFSHIHKIAGLILFLPLLFWTVSGVYFTLFPIDEIRGRHLIEDPFKNALTLEHEVVSPGALALDSPTQITLRSGLSGPVYEAEHNGKISVFDATTGQPLPTMDESEAKALAKAYWVGEGNILSVSFVEEPPREGFSERPLWRVDFDGPEHATLWIDPQTHRLKATRTDRWRVFDVLWRFHIMDFEGVDKFDT